MGYTHYWQKEKCSPESFEELSRFAKCGAEILKDEGIEIVSFTGEAGTLPTFEPDYINFNGESFLGHENFSLSLNRDCWEFCKTARKPYDALVVAVLMKADELGILTWSSDGDEEDHKHGAALKKDIEEKISPRG